ncbi:hypothetical protein Q5530_12820 [Saccharothrix sp. BKS2]|uniref:Uncharacterized protein n=1 Tax=Saccharothrix lopnurensis TaxID=1670621 RepID=A0ABW1PGZ2_9PSEU
MNATRSELLRELTRLGVRPATTGVRVDTFGHLVDRPDATLAPTMCATRHAVPAPAGR